MNIADFRNIIETQEFVSFEFKHTALSEIENGTFFCFLGTFYQAKGDKNMRFRVCIDLKGETKIIPNSYKVSAIINQ